MSNPRKFEVSGADDLGEVHAFRTDDQDRAEEMQRQMVKDFENVELTEHFPRRRGKFCPS